MLCHESKMVVAKERANSLKEVRRKRRQFAQDSEFVGLERIIEFMMNNLARQIT